MPITLRGGAPQTVFRANTPIDLTGQTRVSALFKFKILNGSFDFLDIPLSDVDGTGFTVKGGSTGVVAAGYRTTASNVTATVATGVGAGSVLTIFVLAHAGVGTSVYSGGTLVATLAASGTLYPDYYARLQGSSQSGRNIEILDAAFWVGTPPTPSDIASYESTGLAGFSVPPTHPVDLSGVNGTWAQTLPMGAGNALTQIAGDTPSTGPLYPFHSSAPDYLTIDYAEPVLQRNTPNAANRLFTGTYGGTASTPIRYRVRVGADVVKDWGAPTDLVWSGGVFSFTAEGLPVGVGVTLEIEDSGAPKLSASTPPLSVGDILHVNGQSNASLLTSAPVNTVVTPRDGCYVWNNGAWSQGSSSLQYLANALSEKSGVPVSLVLQAVGGASITLLVPGTPAFNAVTTRMQALGDFCGAIFGHGESNVGMDGAEYMGFLDDLEAGYVDISGRAPENFRMILWGLARRDGSTGTDWAEMRKTQADWCDMSPQRYLGANAIDAELAPGDDLHYTADWRLILSDRLADTNAYALGLQGYDGRGPLPVGYAVDGGELVIHFNPNGTGHLVDGAAVDVEVLTGGGAPVPIDSAEVINNRLRVAVTDPQQAGEGLTVRYLWSNDPDISAPIAGNLGGAPVGMFSVGFAPLVEVELSGNGVEFGGSGTQVFVGSKTPITSYTIEWV